MDELLNDRVLGAAPMAATLKDLIAADQAQLAARQQAVAASLRAQAAAVALMQPDTAYAVDPAAVGLTVAVKIDGTLMYLKVVDPATVPVPAPA